MHTPGLWRHKWYPIFFSLVVDNFGTKYIGIEHVIVLLHILINSIQLLRTGIVYCTVVSYFSGITINAQLIFPYQGMWQQPYTISIIHHHSGNNMHYIYGSNSDMVPNNKWHANWTYHPYCQTKKNTHTKNVGSVTILWKGSWIHYFGNLGIHCG